MRPRTITSLALLLLAVMLASPVAALDEPTPAASLAPVPSTSAAASGMPDGAGVPEGAAVPHDAGSFLVDPAWRDITPSRGPGAREDHTWTVDRAGEYAYLFGGRDGDRVLGDLWRFDLQRDRWQRLSPRGRRPGPRFGHSAVWLDGSGLVVFGGQRGADFFADLWAYDPTAERWTKLPGRGQAPRPRYGSCMVIGPDGRLRISHGFTSAGRFDDTRAYDLARRRWTSLAPDGRRPGERCLHDCFTSLGGDMVLYGGQDDGAFALGDLWALEPGGRWQRQPDPPLRPRRLYAVTEAGPDAYVFGGAGEDSAALGDLWRVDRSSLRFERVVVDGPAPPPRSAGTLVTDMRRGRLLLFGGQAGRSRADVWELTDRSSFMPAVEDPQAPASPLP